MEQNDRFACASGHPVHPNVPDLLQVMIECHLYLTVPLSGGHFSHLTTPSPPRPTEASTTTHERESLTRGRLARIPEFPTGR
jgi:hypothetical protein